MVDNSFAPAIQAEIITEEVSFDEFISRGQELREKADNLQWEFGDLALDFTREVGKKHLPDLARGIGVKITTLRRYRDVSKVFPIQVRKEFPMLSWSHFRAVASSENRNVLLVRAHDENWSVEKTLVMSKPKQDDVIDDGGHVPPKPELLFDTDLRLWYIANKKEDARHVRDNLKDKANVY